MLFLCVFRYSCAHLLYENHSIGHLQRPSRLRRSLIMVAQEYNEHTSKDARFLLQGKAARLVIQTCLAALLPKGNESVARVLPCRR